MLKKHSYWLKIALSLSLIIIVIAHVDFSTLMASLAMMPIWYFVLISMLNVGILTIATLRWWLVVPEYRFASLMMVTYSTQHVAFILPSSFTTDVIRMYSMRGGAKGNANSLVALVVDKYIGIVGICFAFAAAWINIGTESAIVSTGALRIAGNAAIAISVLMILSVTTNVGWSMAIRSVVLVSHFVRRFWPSAGLFMNDISHQLHLFSLHKWRLLLSLLLALGYQLVISVGYLILFATLGHRLTFLEALWISSLLQLALLFPMGIAGIGVRELMFVLVLGELGIKQEMALTAALSNYPVTVTFAIFSWALQLARGREWTVLNR